MNELNIEKATLDHATTTYLIIKDNPNAVNSIYDSIKPWRFVYEVLPNGYFTHWFKAKDNGDILWCFPKFLEKGYSREVLEQIKLVTAIIMVGGEANKL